jgi:Haem-binding domain
MSIRPLASRFLLVLLALFAAIQMWRPDRTNPPVDASNRIEAHLDVPPEIKATLARACRDCHSNETVWPWYSHVAPASWLLARDVTMAREQMNLSEWGEYDAESAADIVKEMCEEVRSGAMPLMPYTWLHRDARLSPTDVQRLCDWTEKARQSLPAPE